MEKSELIKFRFKGKRFFKRINTLSSSERNTQPLVLSMRTNEFFASQMKEGLLLGWKSTSMPLVLSHGKDLIISINFKIVGYHHFFQQLIVSKLFEEKPLR